eukprot:gene10164-18832_t
MTDTEFETLVKAVIDIILSSAECHDIEWESKDCTITHFTTRDDSMYTFIKEEEVSSMQDNTLICNESMECKALSDGAVKAISWTCQNGHQGSWTSSEVLCVHHNSDVFVNDLLNPIYVLLSLLVPDITTFSRTQNFFGAPEITELWEAMKENVIKTLNDFDEICLCGVGRNDSPGHSAKFCSYVAMEQFTKVIVDLEVLDVREVGSSTNMEREGLTRILGRLSKKLNVAEIVTDASCAIIKRVKEISEKTET